MRKPRTALRITNNNLNLNEDPNVNYEIMESRMNQAEYRAEQEARAKYYAVPKNTFRFAIQYYDEEEGTYGEFRTVTTRPMPLRDRRILPIRAMDFLQMIPEDERELGVADVRMIKIFYMGVEPEESYYCLIRHVPFSRYYSEPENYNSNEDLWNIHFYGRAVARPRSRWLVYFLDPLDFFRNEYFISYPTEADHTLWSWYSMVRFVHDLPHLEEKAEREQSAIQSLRESILRHQRRVVTPMAAQFMKETKQVVPENVEGIIRSFI